MDRTRHCSRGRRTGGRVRRSLEPAAGLQLRHGAAAPRPGCMGMGIMGWGGSREVVVGHSLYSLVRKPTTASGLVIASEQTPVGRPGPWQATVNPPPRSRATRALFTSTKKNLIFFKILHHIEFLDACMEY